MSIGDSCAQDGEAQGNLHIDWIVGTGPLSTLLSLEGKELILCHE